MRRDFVRRWSGTIDGDLQILLDVLCYLDFGTHVVLKMTSRRFREPIDGNATLLARQRKFRLRLSGPLRGYMTTVSHQLTVYEEPENATEYFWSGRDFYSNDHDNFIVFWAKFDGALTEKLYSSLKSAQDLMGPVGASIITQTAFFGVPWTDDQGWALFLLLLEEDELRCLGFCRASPEITRVLYLDKFIISDETAARIYAVRACRWKPNEYQFRNIGAQTR